MAKILIVDPLTLLGRELLACLQHDAELRGALSYRHTEPDEEHQIAELSGEPALVPPIEGPADLDFADAVLVASMAANPRLDQLARFMDESPETPVVVCGRPEGLWERTRPATGAQASPESDHLRVAHPALIALSVMLDALSDFGPIWANLAAVEPVSSRGQGEVELVARQAALRLQGAPVEELIDGQVLAFNLVGVDSDDLTEEAASLFPDLQLAVTRSASGFFHGHVAHIAVGVRHSIDRDELEDLFDGDPRIAEPGFPLALDSRTDTDRVALTPPVLSADGRMLAATAMVDGLRIGGALTALEILRSLI
jgi:hypothetical protein